MDKINLEKLMQAQFDEAKLWLSLATGTAIAILIIDVVVLFITRWSVFFALLAALFTILNSIFLWRSDRLRDTAERILRKFEMFKSLGWEISSREIANLLAAAPKSVKKAARSKEEYNFFASTEKVGVKKLLENLEESAWWSKHQANRMATYMGIAGLAMTLLAIFTLIFISQVKTTPASEIIPKIIIAIIVFVFSGEYVKLAFDYHLFASQARETEELAFHMQQEDDISEMEATKLLHDYQIERAGSPLLPTWLWKIVSKELNELWNERMRK